MANETMITLVGNATRVELRFTAAGKAVASFALASTPRNFDRQSGEWTDGETLWLNCSVFGQQAESLVEMVGDQRSVRVIVYGRLKSRSFESKGEKRTVIEVDVEEVGPSLRYATASVQRSQGDGRQDRKPADPWANGGDEPPF